MNSLHIKALILILKDILPFVLFVIYFGLLAFLVGYFDSPIPVIAGLLGPLGMCLLISHYLDRLEELKKSEKKNNEILGRFWSIPTRH